MGFATGVLRWPPDVFWKSTPHELMAAIDGWMLSKGVKPKGTAPPQDAIDEMMERFPDYKRPSVH